MIAFVLSKAIAALLGIFVARHLGSEAFGKYSVATNLVLLFAIFVDFGLTILATREVSRNEEQATKYLTNGVFIKLILIPPTVLLILLFASLLNYPPDIQLLIYFAIPLLLISSFNSFFNSIFRAFEKMKYEALVQITEGILALGLVLFFLYGGRGVLSVIVARILGGIVAFILSLTIIFRFFAKLNLKLDLDSCRKMIREAFPFALFAFLWSIYYRIDIIMLSKIKDPTVAGWYNIAVMIVGTIILFIPAIVLRASFPALSKLYKSSREELKSASEKLLRFLLFLGVLISIAGVFLSRRFVLVVLGSQYLESVAPLQILFLSLIFVFPNFVLTQTLYAADKQRLPIYAIGICALVNIVLNLLLIPRMSHVGASIATVLSEGLLCLLISYLVSKHLFRLSLFPSPRTP